MLLCAPPCTILITHRWYNVPPDETDSESDVDDEQVVEESIEDAVPEAVEETIQEYDIQPPTQRITPTGVARTSDTHRVVPIQSLDTSSSAALLAAANSGNSICDYAFQKAKEASYALGYWTAMYEMQSQQV